MSNRSIPAPTVYMFVNGKLVGGTPDVLPRLGEAQAAVLATAGKRRAS